MLLKEKIFARVAKAMQKVSAGQTEPIIKAVEQALKFANAAWEKVYCDAKSCQLSIP